MRVGAWRGLVAPHAGWRYSGKAAAVAYHALGAAHPGAELAVIFGSHRGPEGPNTVFLGESWETPIGDLENHVDKARELRAALDLDEEPVAPASYDNGVELHLPFLRSAFPKARFLMLGIAAARVAADIGRRVGEVCTGYDTVFLASTDLTHYGPAYGFTPRGETASAIGWVREINDQRFLDAILTGASGVALTRGTNERSACCPGAVAAAIEALRGYGHALAPRLLSHYTSYDVAPSDNAVGYAGLVL